jgi:hypothetical protein
MRVHWIVFKGTDKLIDVNETQYHFPDVSLHFLTQNHRLRLKLRTDSSLSLSLTSRCL